MKVGGGLGDNDDGDEDVDKTLRTGGGEGRGPMEILFLITVLLGGWLGVVARLIIARWYGATTLIVSMTFPNCICAPPKRGRYWEISRAEGMDFPIPPEFWWSTDILLIINSSTGMDQEIHPCGQGRIDSVKLNSSLLRMRECFLWKFVME